MDNISGNIDYSVLAQGVNTKKKENKKEIIINDLKPLNIDLKPIIKEIKEYYKTNPTKHLSDALVNLESANKSLKN